MTTQGSIPANQGWSEDREVHTHRRGTGWVVTAGILLLLGGWSLLNTGLWALHANGNIQKTVTGTLLFSDTDLDTWGWIYTIAGVVVMLAAIGVFFRAQLAVWLGIAAAALSIAIEFLWLFTPYWPQALVGIGLDTFVIWALSAYALEHDAYA